MIFFITLYSGVSFSSHMNELSFIKILKILQKGIDKVTMIKYNIIKDKAIDKLPHSYL